MSEKKTGLGRQALFAKRDEENQEEKQEPSLPRKVRTTVTVYPETLRKMEALKLKARMVTGRSVSLGEILSEAIDELAQKRGVEV